MTLSSPHLVHPRTDPPGGRRREESEQRRQRILKAAQGCLAVHAVGLRAYR